MPGVTVNLVRVPLARFNPTSTGKWFIAQLLERGSTTTPILVTSMTQFKELCGNRVAYSNAWDCAEEFFEEGGSELFLSRVVGETPVIASKILKDEEAAEALVVHAENAGDWGNNLEVQVTAGKVSGYRLVIFLSKVLVDETPDLATQVAAVTWSEGSKWVNVTVGAGTKVPTTVAAAKLTSGSYDPEHVVTASYEAALSRFHTGLGCGQVSVPGNTTEAVAKLVEAHAEAHNRTGLIDLTDSGTVGTLVSAAALLRTPTGARRSAAYAPWAFIPGLANEAPRKVPYSAVQAGLLARNDASTTPPPVGNPSAGVLGRPRNVVGLTQKWSRAEREELNTGSVNVVRELPSGIVETYGNRALVSGEVEPAWQEISSGRLYMYVWAQGEEILEKEEFRNIDNKNLLFSKIEGEFVDLLMGLGTAIENNPATAVNCGPSVNTPTTKGKKEILANVEVKPSQIAETAILNLSAVA